MAVGVDVEWVCAGHGVEVGDRVGDSVERELAAHLGLVAVQRRGSFTAGEVQVGAPVRVAVEDRHASADEVLELAVVAVVDPGRGRLVDELRRSAHRRRPLVAVTRRRVAP